MFATRHRAPLAVAARRESTAPAAVAAVLTELASRREHAEFIAAGGGAGGLLAAMRPHVRGVVGVEPDSARRNRVAGRFAADPGVQVRSGEPSSVVGDLLEAAPRPPLVWIGHAPEGEASTLLSALAGRRSPVGTTLALALPARGSRAHAELTTAAAAAFPTARRSQSADVLVIET